MKMRGTGYDDGYFYVFNDYLLIILNGVLGGRISLPVNTEIGEYRRFPA